MTVSAPLAMGHNENVMSKNKTILVTGGSGYIGSHTCVALMEAGYNVVVIDNLSNSEAWVVDRVGEICARKPEFCQIDLQDRIAVQQFFKDHRSLDGVIHFAASKAVGDSVANPLKYYRNNLGSLVNLLEGVLENGIESVVFSSSCTVYGQPDELPVTEDAPIKRAESPYGNTKQISEEILADTQVAHPDLQVIALRYFNPIGAHPSARIGELPRGVPDNLIPYVTQTAAGLRDKLRVFGNDYSTRDGSCIRDYIHVVDLAEAHVVAMDRLLNRWNADSLEVFNLGTGTGVSVLEVIASFEKVSGRKLPYEITARRPGDIEQVWADTCRANEVLGWTAKRSLDDALESAWRWECALRGIDKA